MVRGKNHGHRLSLHSLTVLTQKHIVKYIFIILKCIYLFPSVCQHTLEAFRIGLLNLPVLTISITSINHYFYCLGIIIDLEISSVFLFVVSAYPPVVACQIYQLDSRLYVIRSLGLYPCHFGQSSRPWHGIHGCQQASALERRNKGLIVWGRALQM